ncbi:hypothetical protein Noda2021_08130 [Candidatus Dependentiae bacterium Noda2021]|nr:hypothetical protein Noda2021_08130 [Candidatus Dependentiae bacterium Noda2021]
MVGLLLLILCGMTNAMDTYMFDEQTYKRKHEDYNHDQGPVRKVARCDAAAFSSLVGDHEIDAFSLQAALVIKKSKSCCYLHDLNNAQRIARFLKLQSTNCSENPIMVPVIITSDPATAKACISDFSKGFSITSSTEVVAHYDWFPDYLPLDWLSMMSEESSLILSANATPPFRLSLWPLKRASYRPGHPEVKSFQRCLSEKYEEFVLTEAAEYHDKMDLH